MSDHVAISKLLLANVINHIASRAEHIDMLRQLRAICDGPPLPDPRLQSSGGPNWIGVDLDRTLVRRESGMSITEIGEPIWIMVGRVQKWLLLGKRVKIFTARVSSLHSDREEQRQLITDWCFTIFGRSLEVTSEKDRFMTILYDDLAIRVEENTGRICETCMNVKT